LPQAIDNGIALRDGKQPGTSEIPRQAGLSGAIWQKDVWQKDRNTPRGRRQRLRCFCHSSFCLLNDSAASPAPRHLGDTRFSTTHQSSARSSSHNRSAQGQKTGQVRKRRSELSSLRSQIVLTPFHVPNSSDPFSRSFHVP
jgi:hypothetical protein